MEAEKDQEVEVVEEEKDQEVEEEVVEEEKGHQLLDLSLDHSV